MHKNSAAANSMNDQNKLSCRLDSDSDSSDGIDDRLWDSLY